MNTRTRDMRVGWSVEPEDIVGPGQGPARGVRTGLGSRGEVGR